MENEEFPPNKLADRQGLRNQWIDIIVIPDNDRESEDYGIKGRREVRGKKQIVDNWKDVISLDFRMQLLILNRIKKRFKYE